MDWLDFLFGIVVGASLCEEEYELNRRENFERDFEEFMFEAKLREKSDFYRKYKT